MSFSAEERKDLSPGTRRFLRAINTVATVNFFAFFGIALLIGGDALNGHSDHGHFYLSSHGHETEVSESVFLYSKIHLISVFITIPAAMIACAILYRQRS
jgi:hypothetical protein